MVILLDLPQRKNIRLKGYDYSNAGYYFITICTHNRQPLFGSIDNGQMILNEYGQIAMQDLLLIPEGFINVKLDKFVVMPNHLHGIIAITGDEIGQSEAERSRPFPTAVIPKIIGLYKSGIARKIHELDPGIIVWQKSYHDHIIRNEAEYQKIWEYIDTNPLKWEIDKYYR